MSPFLIMTNIIGVSEQIKPAPPLPRLHPSDEMVNEVMTFVRTRVNDLLSVSQDIALSKDSRLFLKVADEVKNTNFSVEYWTRIVSDKRSKRITLYYHLFPFTTTHYHQLGTCSNKPLVTPNSDPTSPIIASLEEDPSTTSQLLLLKGEALLTSATSVNSKLDFETSYNSINSRPFLGLSFDHSLPIAKGKGIQCFIRMRGNAWESNGWHYSNVGILLPLMLYQKS
ncbi:hypothetical protein Fmac_011179 [Flemingia macrophylla]|uniref:Uncharacterized protein n=1 Tax=Flemingia macrophylla TaxID=520843 RepID=A0ABD1MLP1_9FABA